MRRVPAIAIFVMLSAMPWPAWSAPPDQLRPSPALDADGGPRIRPYDGRSAAVLLEGLRLSPTLRALVDAIERGNVIIYVRTEHALRGRLAGSLHFMTATDAFRYVRISLNPELRGAIAVAMLAHELQHALEVANEPSIVDERSLNEFYRVHGISVRAQHAGWDTEAAREMGDVVRRDLLGARTRVIESIQEYTPEQWQVVYRGARDQALER